jgi:hypothetical protein
VTTAAAPHIDPNRASASSTLCRLVKLSGSTDTSVALADILKGECARRLGPRADRKASGHCAGTERATLTVAR